MRLPTPLATIVLAAASLSAQNLSTYRNHARPILIFAPTPDDPQLQIQLRYLHENPSAVTERDIIALPIPLTGPTAESCRRRFHIAPADFAVILIGKDGGEKLRSKTPLTLEKLIQTIDVMPMRQDEVKHR